VRKGRDGAEDVLRAPHEKILNPLLPRLLFIVSAHRGDLYAKLKVALASEPNVEIYLDRRVGPRRAEAGEVTSDRRRAERRQREAIDGEVRDRGWAVVKVSPDLQGRPRWKDILSG
jgi:hypothetical protein